MNYVLPKLPKPAGATVAFKTYQFGQNYDKAVSWHKQLGDVFPRSRGFVLHEPEYVEDGRGWIIRVDKVVEAPSDQRRTK